MRKNILLILLLLSCVSFQLMAQNAKGEVNDSTFRTKLLMDNYNYRHKIGSIEDSIKAKGDQIKAARQELQRLKALVALEKSGAQSQRYNKILDSLQKCKEELSDSVAKLSNVASPNQQSGDDVVCQLRKNHDDCVNEIERLRQQLTDMGNFKTMWVKQTVASVGDLAERPLSQFSLTEVELAISQLEEVAAKDKSVAATLTKMKKIQSEKTAYDAAVKVISELYDAANVASATDVVQKMLATAAGDKKDELSDLSWRLRYYADCLDIFKEVVDRVETEGGERNYTKAEEVFKAEEDDGEGITTMQKIPWINTTFENYKKALKGHNANGLKTIKALLGK